MAAKKKQSAGTKVGIEDAVATALEGIRAAKAALAKVDLAKLTSEERKVSSGRLREGEAAVLHVVLDTVDEHPAMFVSLADRDGGTDPEALETGPSREALNRRDLLAPLSDELEALLSAISDDILVSAAAAKALTVPAYAIIRANAPVNAKLRRSASSALDFYAKAARRKK